MKTLIKLLFYFSICSIYSQTLIPNHYQDTQGHVDVSSDGQVTFELPIALPPSIADVGPKIVLSYNSGQSGGIAGQGWDINGLSVIRRISTRIDLDGFRDGVDFDANDKLAIDGMRLLLKSGNYLADGAEYITEIHSNTKIQQIGSGNAAEILVTEPDGSRKWYKHFGTDNRTFYIYKVEDFNGNFIFYNYQILHHVVYLDNIEFSCNNTSSIDCINEIQFIYSPLIRREIYYDAGVKKEKRMKLERINVWTNGLDENNLHDMFRSYHLEHITNDLGYERVFKITERNSQGEESNPIIFEYDTTVMQPQQYPMPVSAINNQINFNNNAKFGDFNGDGNIGVIFDDKLVNNMFVNYSIQNAFINLPNGITSSNSHITSLVDNNNKYNQKNSLTNFRVQNNNVLNIRNFTLSGSNFQTQERNVNLGFSPNPFFGGLDLDNGLVGDFNGDGISEFYFLNAINSPDYCSTYLLDLNNNNSNPLIELATPYFGGSSPAYAPYLNITKSFVQDFNGDGKDDILNIKFIPSQNHYTYTIYSLNIVPNYVWDVIGTGILHHFHPDKYLGIGDFNGDGKIDLIIPDGGHDWVDPPENHNANWHIYYANPGGQFVNGGFFNKETVHIAPYAKPSSDNYYNLRVFFHHYVVLDADGDGKSDLVWIKQENYKENFSFDKKERRDLKVYSNRIGHSNSPNFVNSYSYHTNYGTSNWQALFPLAVPFNKNNINSRLGLAYPKESCCSPVMIHFNFTKDNKKDNRLKKVKTSVGQIEHEFEYDEMKSNHNDGTYRSISTLNNVYPLVFVNEMKETYAVRKHTIKHTLNNNITLKHRDFRYMNFIYNHYKGGLGFEHFAKSSWYTNSNEKKTWQGVQYDVTKLNTPFWSYTEMYNPNVNFQFRNFQNFIGFSNRELLNHSRQFFNFFTNHNTVAVALLKTQNLTADLKSNVHKTIINSYTHDNFYNLSKTESFTAPILSPTLSTNTTNYFYDNNPTGVGKNYYIGRVNRIHTVTTKYNDTKQHEELFSYDANHRLIKTQKRPIVSGQNLPYITEDFEYFANGLLKKKTLSAPDATPAVTARPIEYTYDPTNRFVKTTTDHFGHTQTNDTYHPVYGLVTQSTNHLGQSTHYLFDNWGKQIRITDYLGKKIRTVYQKRFGLYTTSNISDDGSITKTIKDIFGKTIYKAHTDVLSRWVASKMEYDSKDRLWRSSEPYLDGQAFLIGQDPNFSVPNDGANNSPTLWTTQTYDDYSRVIARTTPAGLTATNTYAIEPSIGNRVTTVEGVKSNVVILDVIGNKKQTTDHGGTINYTYDANNNLIQTNYDGIVLNMGYDHWGRKTSLNDPSAGLYTYQYNIYGDVLQETTPRGRFTYQYTNLGLLEYKKVFNETNSLLGNYQYSYYPTTYKLQNILNLSQTANHPTFLKTFNYDSDYNLSRVGESFVVNNEGFGSMKEFEYDTFGRVKTTHFFAETESGLSSSTTIHSDYQHGHNHQLRDANQTIPLIKTNDMNARGQLTNVDYGNGIKTTNMYSAHGYLENVLHTKFVNNAHQHRLSFFYDFDNQRGNLNYREMVSMQFGYFGELEEYEYDNLDRLTQYPDANGNPITQSYDNRGRITANEVGTYQYNNTLKPYQNTRVLLNPESLAHYQPRPQLNINYNVHKAPNTIHEPGKDRFTFYYDGDGNRLAAYFGNENTDASQRPIRKFYSSDGTFEVTINTQTGQEEILTYVQGNAYVSNIVKKTTTSGSEYLYLHKDYLGSIVAISNQAGDVIEKRHFDAWGNLTKYWKTGGITAIPNGTTTFLLLDRGYTSHEHLLSIGIIHMNGRLYDPKLHRFLMPDNYVQDPSNTQNYNRYSYVLNNPLRYTDPSGEIIFAAAIAIGALVSAITYTITALTTMMDFTAGGLLKSTVVGAISSAVSFGVGSLTANIGPLVERIVAKTLLHGMSQSLVAVATGGNGAQAFVSGALSSLAASLYMGGLNTTQSGNTITIKTWNGLGGSFGKTGFGTVAFGTVAGGVGARLTGGNFWQGAATGLAVSWFNHHLHRQEQVNVEKGLRKVLNDNGMNPDDVPFQTEDEAKCVAECLPDNIYKNAKTPSFKIANIDGLGHVKLKISINEITGKVHSVKLANKIVYLHPKMFGSYLQLASSIGDELSHVIDVLNGNELNWAKMYDEDYMEAKMEVNAHQWEINNFGSPHVSRYMEFRVLVRNYEN